LIELLARSLSKYRLHSALVYRSPMSPFQVTGIMVGCEET